MITRILLTLLLAVFSAGAAARDSARLPDLGSSAGTSMSPEQARQIGAGMLHQMRALDMVLDDPLLHQYVNDLGYRLVAHSNIQKGMDFTFFVVRDNGINAFAAPGGYIGINTGLLTATRNESELAAVLAHEIAHITQRHMQRSMEDTRKMAPLIALTMLGAVLASQGSSSGDAAPAAIASGMGIITQRQISFTRKDEAEADRIGIETLAAAGFNPAGMGDFFDRMQRLTRPGSGGIEVPELLQTHPVTSNRISEARARTHIIEEQREKHPSHMLGSAIRWDDTVAPLSYVTEQETLLATSQPMSQARQLTYALMRERARVLTASNVSNMLDYYDKNISANKGFDNQANHYGYALALTLANKADKALEQLLPLLYRHPGNTVLRLARAMALLQDGQRGQSLAEYAALLKNMPESHPVAEAYAAALLKNGKPAAAARAAAVLKPLLDEEVDEPTLYRTYGRACSLSGQQIRAGEAFADATFLSGKATDALDQLQRLLKRKDLSYYQRARIQARIDYITPIVLELRRRGIKPEQQG